MSSLINHISDFNVKRKFVNFSHLSDDLNKVYIHFSDSDVAFPIAKKLHDGSKIETDPTSLFFELVDAITEQHSDHSFNHLVKILAMEIEKFNNQLLDFKQEEFIQKINQFKSLYDKYGKTNVFTTPMSKWDSLIFDPLQKLVDDKILRTDNFLYLEVISLQSLFTAFLDANTKAKGYASIIATFIQKVDFDKAGLKRSEIMFLEHLTFDLAKDLPDPKAETVLRMLFMRYTYKDKEDQYELRAFSNIEEMVQAIKQPVSSVPKG